MKDVPVVALIATLSAGAVGVIGWGLLVLLRRHSVRDSLIAVVVIAVLAEVASVVGVARAMFLNTHDFGVVITVSAVAGFVAVGIALLLGRQVVAGSRELQGAMRTLGDGGDFAAPANPPTAELAALSQELAATSRRLAESRERERALEASRRELVAWVSHDLRTPLAGLRAMAEALEDDVAEDPRRYHRQIRMEVDRLTSMVDDLFELSRIHAGALRLSLSTVSLSDLVGDALAGVDPLARARGVRLRWDLAKQVPVHVDSGEMTRALTNLVVNAIRHTPSDGTVEVAATTEGGAAVLAVTDCCGGIPEADLERLFDIAWRGTHARTPGPDGGAGLGLAIARGIVEAHAGRIAVANTGDGCRFEVRLPLRAGA